MKTKVDQKKCSCCGQATQYGLAIDKGTVKIVKEIALFIGKKGINIVHPRKEMEGVELTSNEVGNLTRARVHGLIAKVKGKNMAGNYCLTSKGAKFLRGEVVPKIAIVSKAEKKQIGYIENEYCTINDKEINAGDYWNGLGYDIHEGKVVYLSL